MCLCIFRIYSPSRGDFTEVMNGRIILVERDDKKLFFTVCSIPSSCQLQNHTYCNDNDWHHPTEYAVTDVCPPLLFLLSKAL